jgi:hypothetical protein
MKKRNRKSPKADNNRENIRILYGMGNTTRAIAEKLRLSKTYVHRLLSEMGITRTTSEALSGKWTKPESTHWRTTRNRARKLVERRLGRKLLREEHVHHRNGDHTDNRLSNLEVVLQRDHAYIHHPLNPVPRHKRPERMAYMKAYGKRRWAERQNRRVSEPSPERM